MRKIKQLLVLLMTLSLLLGFLGCGSETPGGTASSDIPTTEVPTEPPVSMQYTQAAQALRDAKDLDIEMKIKKTIKTGIDEFKQVSDLELILTGIGTDAFAASLNEELEIDDIGDEYTEFYSNGNLYVDIADAGCFQGNMKEEAFLSRFAPVALLDETLYTHISADESDTGITLTFSDPSAAEDWALPTGAEFLSASGTAKISNTGILTKTTYTIEYRQNNTTVSMEVTSKGKIYDEAPLEAPTDTDTYQKIDAIDALRLYDTAVLYLLRAETASSTIKQTTVSQAINYVLTEETELYYTGTSKNHISEVRYTATATDDSMKPDVFSQTETYKDGIYTYIGEDGKPESDTEITPVEMYIYLQEYYNDNIPAMGYIVNATAEDIGGLLYIEMKLNEEWAQASADNLNYLLFDDEDYLDNYASAYQTTVSSYYMVIDSATGFPVSSCTSYSGIHTIDGSNYVLGSEIFQTYQLGNPDTYDTLAGETPPEKQATPLLYHVTGADGQEMYLMGTIHVGDSRTAFLPEKVYDAFRASDALAVEADIIKLETELKTNPELAAQYAAAYINPDGKATKDLLDPDTYHRAAKLLKASGSYSSNVEYMKPFVWDNEIANFYVSLGRYSIDKGMDRRLLELAAEQDKKILEVESALFQLEMQSNFSMELQTLMLQSDIHSTLGESLGELDRLYELWCSGDEAALREILKEDTSNLSKEELALYQEYQDAMINNRNEGMLDVAISYLESGDTVFYAVGLAHLLQNNGLVDTLQDAGYTVEQVVYN